MRGAQRATADSRVGTASRTRGVWRKAAATPPVMYALITQTHPQEIVQSIGNSNSILKLR